ncbi:hypothetical protein D3C72_1751940 [compost metagenome]
MARAVVVERRDVVAGLVVVALGELLEHVAPGVLQLVLRVAEDERKVGDGQRLVAVAREARAGQHDVDRAQRQALVDVGFLAQAGGREHLDVVLAVAALLDLLGRPHRVLVEGLRGLVDVRPLELGLRAGDAGSAQRGGRQGASGDGLEGVAFAVHRFVSVVVMG